MQSPGFVCFCFHKLRGRINTVLSIILPWRKAVFISIGLRVQEGEAIIAKSI